MNNIPNEYMIYNISEKTEKDYNKNTICGYKTIDIISALEKTILLNNIEESIFWSSELIASGHFNEKIWEKLFILYSKNINISNPKLSIRILNIYLKFHKLKTKYTSKYELEIRNDQEIRNTLADLITSLTLSTKNNYLSINKNFPKVSQKDLTTDGIKRRIIARDMNLINNYMSNNEPIEVKIALNEIISHLYKNNQKKHKDIFYWIKWLIKIESKLPDKKFICNDRDIKDISNNHKTDWTWILWEIIFTIYKTSHHPSSDALYTLKTLYELYKINYKKSTRTNKMYIIYNAILVICLTQINQIDWNNPIISVSNYSIWIKVCANINVIYKKIAIESNTTHSIYMSILNQQNADKSISSTTSYNDGYITNKLIEQQNYINRIIQDDNTIEQELDNINEKIETSKKYQYNDHQPSHYNNEQQPYNTQYYNYQQSHYNNHGLETRHINIEHNHRQQQEEYHRPVQQINPRQNIDYNRRKNKKISLKKSLKDEEIDNETLKLKERMRYLYIKPPPQPKKKLNKSIGSSLKNKLTVVSDIYMNQPIENNEIQIKNIIID